MALSKGLLAPVGGVTPSVWSSKTTAGLLGGAPTPAPIPQSQSPLFTGGDRFGNYVRRGGAALGAPARTDLMAAFMDPSNEHSQNIAEWGEGHWTSLGQGEGRYLGPRSGVNPAVIRGDVMDSGPEATQFGGGLPQPDVEGYKYVYPIYSWGGTEDPSYSYVGSNTADRSEYPYYPYEPTGEPLRSRNSRILIGHRLVRV